jgi:hypothetical protein
MATQSVSWGDPERLSWCMTALAIDGGGVTQYRPTYEDKSLRWQNKQDLLIMAHLR